MNKCFEFEASLALPAIVQLRRLSIDPMSSTFHAIALAIFRSSVLSAAAVQIRHQKAEDYGGVLDRVS